MWRGDYYSSRCSHSLGLRVDDETIIMPMCNKSLIEWQNIYHQLVVFTPNASKFSENKLKYDTFSVSTTIRKLKNVWNFEFGVLEY